MATNQELSQDEIFLRANAPQFFQELRDAHTATLIEQGNPEALTAWKEVNQLRDLQYDQLPPDIKMNAGETQEQRSIEMQGLEFAGATTRYAAENDISFNEQGLTPGQLADSYARVQREELEHDMLQTALDDGPEPTRQAPHRGHDAPSQTMGDVPLPEDKRFEVARQIDAAKEQHRQQTEPSRNAFGEMSDQARQEFLEEQKQVAQDALHTQQQSIDQAQEQQQQQTVTMPEPVR